MQATKPLRTFYPGRAALVAVVVAAAIVIAAIAVAYIVPLIAAPTQVDAGVAPLVLDPDAREGLGRYNIAPIPQ